MRMLPPLISINIFDSVVNLLIVAAIILIILALFESSLYKRLSTRITVLIFASALATIIIALAFNTITSDTLSPRWLRQLQIASIVLGGPVVLGILTARYIRRPLRQFNDAIAALSHNDNKVQLQPTGIYEFDEVFNQFNQLTSRLQEEEKLRKDLVSDTSHEFNTPLTIMIGQLTAIQEGKYPATRERITIVKEQAERLAELVQQLDAYTKARLPDHSEPEAINLRQFCDELIEHFSLDLKDKEIKVKLEFARDYTLQASRSALHHILTNFIQNTLRYSGATEITITATANSLTFSDNGKGVPSENLPLLFERFYRVDASRNRTTGGLGLGLAIIKELAEQQGWHIRAEHAHPGLVFILSFS